MALLCLAEALLCAWRASSAIHGDIQGLPQVLHRCGASLNRFVNLALRDR